MGVRPHADRPHPALGQDLTPSPTMGRGRAGSGVRAGSARIGARVDRGGNAHFTESVYDQKTAQASVRLKTKVWNPKKRQSMYKCSIRLLTGINLAVVNAGLADRVAQAMTRPRQGKTPDSSRPHRLQSQTLLAHANRLSRPAPPNSKVSLHVKHFATIAPPNV
jgi:hypothetical protein